MNDFLKNINVLKAIIYVIAGIIAFIVYLAFTLPEVINEKLDENLINKMNNPNSTLSVSLHAQIDDNIDQKMKDNTFMKHVNSRLGDVKGDIDKLYEVDSAYTYTLSFDFNSSINFNDRTVRFFANKKKQQVSVLIYDGRDRSILDDDFIIMVDAKEKSKRNFGEYRNGRTDITEYIKDSLEGVSEEHSLTFRANNNSDRYTKIVNKKIIKTFDVSILVKNKRGGNKKWELYTF